MTAIPMEKSHRSRGAVSVVVLILAAAAVTAGWGIVSREHAMAALSQETREMAVTTVAITKPSRGAASEDVSLPGTVQAYTDAAIFARTTGYLKKRYADIGSHVKAGQVLAEIDTPELDQQLMQARADLATAQANEKLAKTTADRYTDLMKTDSVSHQDLDNATGSYEAKKAATASSDANVKRLEELEKFKTIYAPFDGVITTRNTDIGALIGSGASAKELFHIASMDRLRIFVSVPQLYSRSTRPDTPADISVQELPGQTFAGRVARTAQAIDPASRTLLVEIDLDNPKGTILPGSFAQVHLKLPTSETTFRLPVNTLIFRSEGLRIATVKDGVVTLVPITLGRDFGSTVEVVTGLTGAEAVVVNPPDSLAEGQRVNVAPEPQQKRPNP
ncbi:MAG TPA: efflux RND transporter periplasmic adaptor subunit [Vicinamibacterales bacterium]|jgi:RND family efflux transporter MFP subunit|nr:efflux RND transporter periplasmic adaptor subunit [Vicinamibacterales bacterium]